ncbi:MAG: cyclic peptide export ABC transporter [Acidobacteriota bacterium]|nr:cyclic peptide export ABC transporter [Acidobacteriota bacterium]
MKKLLVFIFRYSPVLVILAMFAGMVTGATNTVLIGFINTALDKQGSVPSSLIWGFAGVCLLLPISRVVAQVLLTSLTQQAVFDLRMKLSRQILSSPLRRLEKHGPSKLLAILTNDIGAISGALANIPFLCMNLTIIISGLVYLFYLYFEAGIGVLVAMILAVGIYAKINNIARFHFNQARQKQDTLFEHFEGITSGTKELKLHKKRREAFLNELLRETAMAFRKGNVMGNAWYAGAGSLGQFMFFSIMGTLVFLLPEISPDITPSVLRGYTMVLLYLTLPLDALTQVVPALQMAVISLQRVNELGLSLREADAGGQKETLKVDTQEFGPEWQKLQCKDLIHSYNTKDDEKAFTLGPINLQFTPGELVFLVGGNGSGKTSLSKILLGLYTPSEGELLLDGVPIVQENRDNYRQMFTSIFADFYLFESLLGIDHPRLDEKATEYLERLQLSRKVQIKDGTLSNLNLSQGQRKRLALLTAYLEDRPIYLFDEWAADQDPYFKGIFYHSLLPELKQRGKTVFVISHDDHYYDVADRIIKLDYGQVEYNQKQA